MSVFCNDFFIKKLRPLKMVTFPFTPVRSSYIPPGLALIPIPKDQEGWARMSTNKFISAQVLCNADAKTVFATALDSEYDSYIIVLQSLEPIELKPEKAFTEITASLVNHIDVTVYRRPYEYYDELIPEENRPLSAYWEYKGINFMVLADVVPYGEIVKVIASMIA